MFLTALAKKLHFVFSLVMFLFIALMVVEDELPKRAMLLLPIIFFDIISKVLFSLDQIDRLDIVLDKYREEDSDTIFQIAFFACYTLSVLSQNLFWRNLARVFCRNRIHCNSFARA